MPIKLDSRAAELFDFVRFAGFVLDVAGCTLTGPDGSEVPLRRSEFALLLAFLRAPGRVLSRDHLLDLVAGRQYSPCDRSIDVLVSRLRHRIEVDPQSPHLILTVPGLGYKFTVRPQTAQAAPEILRQAGICTSAVPPDEHSITVAQFEDLSGDIAPDHLAGGITEEIITALSSVSSVAVIQSPDATDGTRKHDARYALGGSIRRTSSHVRIVARLIDTANGRHLWANGFDFVMTDLLELQGKVARNVVAAVTTSFRQLAVKQALAGHADGSQGYDLVLRSHLPASLHTREEIEATRRLLRLAIEIDPNCVIAQALLARCNYVMSTRMLNVPTEPEPTSFFSISRDTADRGREDPDVLACAASILGPAADPDVGLALLDRALTLDPNSAEAWATSGHIHAHMGDVGTALRHMERSQRCNPGRLGMFLQNGLGYVVAYTMAGRYEDALMWIERSARDRPCDPFSLRIKVGLLGILGRVGEARQVLPRLLTFLPDLTVSRVHHHYEVTVKSPFRFNRHGFYQIVCEGLRMAGLPK